MMSKRKTTKKHYVVDISLYSTEVKVVATSKPEARRKAIEKLNKQNIKKLIIKHQTYVDLDSRYH